MSAAETLIKVVDRVAEIAAGVKRKLGYFVFVGVVASGFLSWLVYSAEAELWWNGLKAALIFIPAVVWMFIWSVLNQLQDAPVLVSQLVADDEGLFSNFDELSLSEPNGLSGVFSTLRAFRKEDGLEVVFDTLGGVTLLANPLFAIFAFANWVILFMLTMVALVLAFF